MTFIDLAIIYLACGAPLSMHYFFAASRKPTLYFASKVVLVSLVWPVAAFFLIRPLRIPLAGTILPETGDIGLKLANLRLELEGAAFTDESASSVFEFRELFARYTGLAQAAVVDGGQDSSSELFLLSGHKDPDLASRCFGRRASNRLAAHANAAREDFVGSITAFGVSAEGDLIRPASAVAELVGDPQVVGMLREFCPVRSDSNVGSMLAAKLKSPESVNTTIS